MTDGQRYPSFRDIVRLLRPSQWTKNAIVLAALFFAYWDRAQTIDLAAGLAVALPAALLFCLVSSGVYALNDILDAEADRHHPRKKDRPVAAGRIPVPLAGLLALALIGGGCAAAMRLNTSFGLTTVGYVALQVVYSLALKRVALVDIFMIAAGFVLRAIAGAVALNLGISPWLLLCTFLLALFLALCKRRQEKLVLGERHDEHRPSLAQYDRRLLDQLIAIVSAATVVCYAIYTLSSETIAKFGTDKLAFTIPFVAFGIFRYLDLVYRHEKGERPEKVLLTDLPLLGVLVLYALSVALICRLTR